MILLATAGIQAQDNDLTVTIEKDFDGESVVETFEVPQEQKLEDFLQAQGVDVQRLFERLESSEEMMDDLELDRKKDQPDPNRPFLGIRMTQKLRKVKGNEISRVFIKEVVPGGGAHRAGLLVGDQILSFDGEMVREIEDVTVPVLEKQVGELVEMRVLRDSKMLNINIDLNTAQSIMGEENPYKDQNMSNNRSSATVTAVEKDEQVMLQRMRIYRAPVQGNEQRIKSITVDMRKSWDEKEEQLDVSGLEALNVLDFALSPNPNNGAFNLNFEIKEAAPTKIRLVNLSGTLVYLEDLGNFSGRYDHQIDLENSLPTGVYLLQVVRPDAVYSEKLMVN